MPVENQEKLEKENAKEQRKLLKIFGSIDEKRKNTISGLIQRAAFMRVSLDDLEADINANGFTEQFSQGEQEPYLRERPTAKIYSTMNANYQKIIRQLTNVIQLIKIQINDGIYNVEIGPKKGIYRF